ncbi:MAG: SAM-dependent chlorinase/fluorinase [Bacteroidales bacterium]|nr:SAM-dependent chlorinase/fluorinase [Bacteroidales bacterium]
MQTVSITTDWGNTGIYVGLFKAKLVSRIPDVQLVEITHSIDAYKVADAVFALRNAYPYFGQGTIHIVSVAAINVKDVKKNREFICFQYDGQYFIGPNNGLWSLLLPENPTTVYKLDSSNRDEVAETFIESDIFIDAIQKISSGTPLNEIGEETEYYQGPRFGAPAVEHDGLRGTLLYFDVYGNAVTNITKKQFDEVGKGRAFKITIAQQQYYTTVISKDYESSGKYLIIALFNSSGHLELAVPFMSLKKFLGENANAGVYVQFFDTNDDGQNLRLE